MFHLSPPGIAATNSRPEDQVRQIQNYLYTMVRELEHTLLDYETRIQALENEIKQMKGES